VLNGCAGKNNVPNGASEADVREFMQKLGTSQQERDTYDMMADNLIDRPSPIPEWDPYHRGPKPYSSLYMNRISDKILHAGLKRWLPAYHEDPHSVYNHNIIRVFLECFKDGLLGGEFVSVGAFVNDFRDMKFVENILVPYVWGRQKAIYLKELKNPGSYALENRKCLARKNRKSVSYFKC
jgi:hypothetical protein